MYATGMDKEHFLSAFNETIERMARTAEKKNNDYTVSDDPFDNFMAVELLGVCPAEIGLLTRMTDKFKRVISLIKGKQAMVTDESVEDTLLDLANYAILLKLLRQQRALLSQPPPLEARFKKDEKILAD
jgi:hypothetical protein